MADRLLGDSTLDRGHQLFAVVTTAYILIAIQLEERDLVKAHGDDYREYQRSVRMICPWPSRK
jgi:protein-S-isoprenylcysteine O-methyltransferase Ste14